MTKADVIPVILDRHAEDAAFLWLLRDAAVSAPHYTLQDLTALDNRLDANLDGLLIAGDAGWEVCRAALEIGEPGEVFVAAYLAFQSGDGRRIDPVLNAIAGDPENFRAMVSALGWLDSVQAGLLSKAFCNSNDENYNRLGVAGYAIHRVDPGRALERGLAGNNNLLRARSLKAAGELGRQDLVPELRQYWQEEDEACRFWSAWSAALLGDTDAVSALKAFVNFGSVFELKAMELAVRLMDADSVTNWLTGLAQEEGTRRIALMGAGFSGIPAYVPSLLNQMEEPIFARVAGEAFSMITGADLGYLDLEAEWPGDFRAGPTENPEDESVDLDPDEDLPWPAPELIRQWWFDNESRFSVGSRYLSGDMISREHCQRVLASGYQRQRQAAALELTLSNSGLKLFETRAPGFRQQKN